MTRMRILVTGSRDWADMGQIQDALEAAHTLHGDRPWPVTVVHGDCPTGADRLARNLAWLRGWDDEPHPADWEAWGKRAGYVRNKEMVDLGADICLAFIKNNSRGATMTERMAREAGIVTIVYREGVASA